MDEADRCDRLLLMRAGRIIADGTPAEIRERTGTSDIEQAFLALVAQDSGAPGEGERS
jgi:ABC-2 type transport system ATP-binding protein